MKTRKFDIERAKKGARVITEDHKQVIILQSDPLIIAKKNERRWDLYDSYNKDGTHPHLPDLLLIDEPVKGDFVHVKNNSEWRKREFIAIDKDKYITYLSDDPRVAQTWDRCYEFEQSENAKQKDFHNVTNNELINELKKRGFEVIKNFQISL